MATKKVLIVHNITKITDIKWQEQLQEWEKAFKKFDVLTLAVDNAEAREFYIENKEEILFVLFWDKDFYLGKELESLGATCYNRATTIALCDDKALTQIHLERHKIKTPKTYIFPFIFEKNYLEYFDLIKTKLIQKEIYYPFVLKERVGSFGDQIYLISSEEELIEKLKEVGHKGLLAQEFIEPAKGEDYRCFVARDKLFTMIHRKNDNDFRSNVNQGGKVYEVKLESRVFTKIVEAAKKACAALRAHYAGVDVILDHNNEPLVIEVNSNPRTVSATKILNQNIAELIVEYLLDCIYN